MRSSVNHQRVIFAGFDDYIFHLCAWKLAREVVELGVFVEIEARDEVVREMVVVGKIAVEGVDGGNDGTEIVVDAVASFVQAEG